MPADSEVFEVSVGASIFVPVVLVEQTATSIAAALKTKKDGRGDTMKWQSFMSTFVLNKMYEIISSGVRTDKGLKEVHLNAVAKQVSEFCDKEVTATRVYNHLRNWRARWIQVPKLRDLSSTSWDQSTCSVVLEAEHYTGHVADHPEGAEFLNTLIQNYNQMHHIFAFGLATGKHAMGSGDALVSPLAWQPQSIPGTPDVEEVLDGPDKPFEHVPVVDMKRKRSGLMEEEISVFIGMNEAMKEVATSVRESKTLDVHPDMYITVTEQGGFSYEALMEALSHLLDNKAHGVGFVAMAGAHMVLWLRSWLGKHCY